MIIKKNKYSVFIIALLLASSVSLKADMKETAQETLEQIKERCQEIEQILEEEAGYGICLAQCNHKFSDKKTFAQFACLKKCEINHASKRLKRHLLKQGKTISKKIDSLIKPK